MNAHADAEPTVSRAIHLAGTVAFVDGLPGCGKTMLSPIVAAMERVELLTYAYGVEHACALTHLGKLDDDGAAALIALATDLTLYNTMMGRETNFRPSDLSSAWRSPHPWRHVRRAFGPGDEAVPGRVAAERPILNLTTHRLLAYAKPVFEALGERAAFVEVVRHPLYMIRQQGLNMERLVGDVRDFDVYFRHGDAELPYWTRGWEDLFLASGPMDRAIHSIARIGALVTRTRDALSKRYGARILTVPFERFVIEPEPLMRRIEELLGTASTARTERELKRQRVPRKRWAEGVDLAIYKRCGWEPPAAGSTEEQELEVRRRWAEQEASPEAMEVLTRLSAEYEEAHLGGAMGTGGRYA